MQYSRINRLDAWSGLEFQLAYCPL